MCGISGFSGNNFSRLQLEQASYSIKHRGPDAKGIYIDKNIGLAHRRLSILELSNLGAQPYHYDNLILTYNGELYNYKDVRVLLENEGYTFISNSDTEVLIKAFHCWGTSGIRQFIGMFAFAVYDTQSETMYLFRDRLGVKPLYYTLENGLAFCSELKGLTYFMQDRSLHDESVFEYFRMGFISGEKCIYRSANKLAPGHYLVYRNGKAKLHSYWELCPHPEQLQPSTSIDEWKEQLHTLMKEAFNLRMVSDVPVGVFLSGGVDSSLVSAILQASHGNIHTFTIGFNEPRFNEAPYAKLVAEHLGTIHSEAILDASQAFPILQDFYEVYDEPFADSSGIPTVLVSRIAKQAGMKVVLSADGGDELFMGYKHYRESYRLYQKFRQIPLPLRTPAAKVFAKFYSSGVLRSVYSKNSEHRTAALAELLASTDLNDFYTAKQANQSTHELSRLLNYNGKADYKSFPKEDISSLMLWDLQYYLPDDLLVKMDRATMYNSIEGREPFLDHRLVELAYQIPNNLKYKNGVSKWIVKEILAEYLPTALIERPKKGFSIPLFQWFRSEMDQLFEHYLSPNRLTQVASLNGGEVMNEYAKYKHYRSKGREYNIEKMWRILSFMMWWDKCYKKLD